MNSPFVCVDETGWPVNGKNWWMWVFRFINGVFFKIAPSRSSRVPKEVLGNDYQGVLCSDFYSAYNSINALKQKCQPHFQREIKGWDKSESFEKRSFHYGCHLTFQKAIKLLSKKESLTEEKYGQKVDKFKKTSKNLCIYSDPLLF